jgi:DNA invertase Pin-like site-specific DNA recombinase
MTSKRSARNRQGDPKTAVAYLRVSTEDQNLGPEAQRASIERWAKANGVQLVDVHEDRISGAAPIEERPGLMAAIESVRAHGAGLLVAAKRDRLAREVVIAATIERIAQDAGARVVTSDGVSVENTPEGALMRGLLDLFAAYERAVIRARTKSALAAKRARGERVTRRPPIGWRFEGGRLVEDLAEQKALRVALEMRASGVSVQRIADHLNEGGTSCRGGRWHVTTLVRVLAKHAAATVAA